MTPEQRRLLLEEAENLLPVSLDEVMTPSSTGPPTPVLTYREPSPPPSPILASAELVIPEDFPLESNSLPPSPAPAPAPAQTPVSVRVAERLHPTTTVPHVSTIEPEFLNPQDKCARCTIRIVDVLEGVAGLPRRWAVVYWGNMPYFTSSGHPAEFPYHSKELLDHVRPELIEAWEREQEEIESRKKNAATEQEHEKLVKEQVEAMTLARHRLQDSWVVDQLAYWVEYIDEWKSYREYYVCRRELFDECELGHVVCPGCDHCGGFVEDDEDW